MSFPLKLEIVSTADAKTKKSWRRVQWDGKQSENVSLLGHKTIAQLNLVSGKKKRVDASIRKLLGKVVYINTSTTGECVVGMLQDGHLFRWRKNTRTITNIFPCPDFAPISGEGDTAGKGFIRRPRLFIGDDGNSILLFSRHSGVYIWRSVGFHNSGWSRITIGSAASALLSAKGVTLDAVFYDDEVGGPTCHCAFISSSDDSLNAGTLLLRLDEQESPANYFLHKYPYNKFLPPCIPMFSRKCHLPCWSRNGRVLAVSVNQRMPSNAKILLIQPDNGAVINVGFGEVLKNAVAMSFWITSMSWTYDNLILACSIKQGAVLLVSASGNILSLMAETLTENFGPGVFLPLEGLVGFRRPAVENLTHGGLEDSTDTSMQSSIVPVKKRKPKFTVAAHPQLPILLCSDGRSVAAIKIINAAEKSDIILSNVVETVQRLERIVKSYNLQMTVLEPLSHFLPTSTPEDKISDEENRWRKIIKSIHHKLFPMSNKNQQNATHISEMMEQAASASFVLQDSQQGEDVSISPKKGGDEEDDKNNKNEFKSFVKASAVNMLSELSICCTKILSTLSLILMNSSEKQQQNANIPTRKENEQDNCSKNELRKMFMLTLKFYCDILLQLEDIVDVIPYESNSSKQSSSLREKICDTALSLGHGFISLIPWNEMSHSETLTISMAVYEIVNTLLMCSRKSSEGCLNSEDVVRNIQTTFLFLTKVESALEKKFRFHQNSPHTDIISPLPSVALPKSIDPQAESSTPTPEQDEDSVEEPRRIKWFFCTSSWQLLADYVEKCQDLNQGSKNHFPLIDSVVSYIQMYTSKQLLPVPRALHDEKILTTRNIIYMCNCLSNYDFCNALASGYGIVATQLSNTNKWTDEKWSPVEILAKVMASYFRGSEVSVPTCLTSLSKEIKYGGISNSYFTHSIKLEQKLITSTIRNHSLDESWDINNAVLLLLSCGRIKQASEIAFSVGDWRTSLAMSAVFEKTSFFEPRSEFENSSDINSSDTQYTRDIATLLKYKFEDILSALLGTKIKFDDENLGIAEAKYLGLDPTLYGKCFSDLFKVAAMVGENVTSWSTCSILGTLKMKCTDILSLIVADDFSLPHPQLYLPQSMTSNVKYEGEIKIRNEISGVLRTLITMLNSIGVTRIVAHWYLKWLDRESSCNHPHHVTGSGKITQPKQHLLADNTMLKDVSIQGLSLDLVCMHGDTSRDEIYILATIFREICAILWMFHVRDKLSVALRKYQNLREKFTKVLEEMDPRDVAEMQKSVENSIHECLLWVRKILPFAKFMRFESAIEDLILCLVTELPLNVDTTNLIAEFFYDEKFTTPKNKHRMQVVVERMRKVQIVVQNDPTTKPLSVIFNEECKRLRGIAAARKDAHARGSHFSLPRTSMSEIMKSMENKGTDSRTNTLTRDEPSQIFETTPNDLLKTLDKCYAFESDDLYHAYIIKFLEILLNKSPASKTFTPKKEGKSRISSRPLTYPLVLTYRNEIAKAELEMIPPYDGQQVKALTITVPIPKFTEPSLDSVASGEDIIPAPSDTKENHAEAPYSSYFSNLEKKCEPDVFGLNHANEKCDFIPVLRELPHLKLDSASPSFRKRLVRLIPYFAWLEHWRTEVVNIPQKHQFVTGVKSAMRVKISTEHLVHGFTVAEFRFGKKVKSRERKVATINTSVPSTLIDDEVDSHTQSDSEVSEITPLPVEEMESRETKPMKTFDQSSEEQDEKGQTIEKELQESGDKVTDAPEKFKTAIPIVDVLEHSEKQLIGDGNDIAAEKELEIEDLEAPVPTAGNVQKKHFPEVASQEIPPINKAESVIGVAAHSVVSVSSTGLQSDIMPDGGGKLRGSRITKKKELEKQDLQHLIRNEMQSVMVGHQVFILAQILQSIALHASYNQNPTMRMPTPQQQQQQSTVQQSPPTPQKYKRNDGRLQILTLEGESSYVYPNPRSPRQSRQSRIPLKIISENQSLRASHTTFLHESAPNLYSAPGRSASQNQPPIPVMYDTRKAPHYAQTTETKQEFPVPQEKLRAEAESPVLTTEMLQQSKQPTEHQSKPQSADQRTCPTCHTHSAPKQASGLPLLQLAGVRGPTKNMSSTAQLPQLVGLRQLLQYEQKRTERTQLRSQSVRHIPQLPLLDATKIPGFYQLKPRIREISVPRTTIQQPKGLAKEPGTQSRVQEMLKESGALPAVDEEETPHETPQIKIPSELLPRVLSLEEADKIRNGVLAHYKIISDQQKAMLREAGQQTEVSDDKGEQVEQYVEHESHFVEEPMRRPQKRKIDRYEMHEDFAQRFLNVDERERSTASSINSEKLKSEKVAKIQGPDADQIPAVQRLVESRWSSAMHQMSSEVDAISGIDRDLKYRRYEDEINVMEREKPHVIPPPVVQQTKSSLSRSSTRSSTRYDKSPSVTFESTHSEKEAYVPKPGIIGEIGERIRREKFEPEHVQRRSAFETDFIQYRKKIDEALQLADPGLYREKSDLSLRSSRHTAVSSSSLQKIDDTMLSSLSWDELEAMITESVLMDAGNEGADWTAEISSVDARIQDSLQLLNELQTGQQEIKQQVKKKGSRVTKQQKINDAKKSKKHAADVDARIHDAMSLLGEIKNDQKQLKTGQFTVTKGTPSKNRHARSNGVDNWTLEAMSLLKELKSEYEPEDRFSISTKENYPPYATRNSTSDNMRAHLEEAMALLKDDTTSQVSFTPRTKFH